MPEALSRNEANESSFVQEVRKLASKLDRDLKQWVAKKYGLLSAGKPEAGLASHWRIPPERWIPDDVSFAGARDNWLRAIQNRTDYEAVRGELEIWEKGAFLHGAARTEVQTGAANEDPAKKPILTWKNVAIGGAVAAGVWYFFFRQSATPSLIAPTVAEPTSIGE